MHEGRLIEEVAMQELLERNRQYVEYAVSDENKDCLLLERKFELTDYSVHENGSIRIYNNFEMRSTFNRCFVKTAFQYQKSMSAKKN